MELPSLGLKKNFLAANLAILSELDSEEPQQEPESQDAEEPELEPEPAATPSGATAFSPAAAAVGATTKRVRRARSMKKKS